MTRRYRPFEPSHDRFVRDTDTEESDMERINVLPMSRSVRA
jgi:hypothetical protein